MRSSYGARVPERARARACVHAAPETNLGTALELMNLMGLRFMN